MRFGWGGGGGWVAIWTRRGEAPRCKLLLTEAITTRKRRCRLLQQSCPTSHSENRIRKGTIAAVRRAVHTGIAKKLVHVKGRRSCCSRGWCYYFLVRRNRRGLPLKALAIYILLGLNNRQLAPRGLEYPGTPVPRIHVGSPRGLPSSDIGPSSTLPCVYVPLLRMTPSTTSRLPKNRGGKHSRTLGLSRLFV